MAIAIGVVPAQVWAMDPADLATVVDVLAEQARRSRR